MKITKTQYKSASYGVVLVLLFIFFDMLLRLNTNTDNTQSNAIELPIINTAVNRKSSQDIVSLYSQFDIEKTITAKNDKDMLAVTTPKKKLGIGLTKEAQQNGTLVNLYFGENKVTLTGIFSSEERFAVVTITPLANKSISVKRLSENQSLFDYTVKAINKKSIDLTRNNQKIKLKLFTK